MRLRKFGHCCLLVEEAGERVLLDPGVFSSDFEQLTDLSAVLVTHVHADHLDVNRLHSLLEGNPRATVLCDQLSAAALADKGVPAQVVRDGDTINVGFDLRTYLADHAVIHPDLPNIPNVGYLIAGRFFYAGDAFIDPTQSVEVLAVPTSAAWLKISETIDYLRAVEPRVAIPVHDHGDIWAEMAHGLLRKLGPAKTEVTVLSPGADLDLK